MYELTGVYPADTFFAVNTSTGALYLKRSLAEDSLQSLTYTVSYELNIFMLSMTQGSHFAAVVMRHGTINYKPLQRDSI